MEKIGQILCVERQPLYLGQFCFLFQFKRNFCHTITSFYLYEIIIP